MNVIKNREFISVKLKHQMILGVMIVHVCVFTKSVGIIQICVFTKFVQILNYDGEWLMWTVFLFERIEYLWQLIKA